MICWVLAPIKETEGHWELEQPLRYELSSGEALHWGKWEPLEGRSRKTWVAGSLSFSGLVLLDQKSNDTNETQQTLKILLNKMLN